MAQEVADAHQQDEAWFKPIYKEMRNGGLEAMLYDLLARDLGDWRPRQIVRTAALGKTEDESLSPLDQWWLELLQSGVLSGTRTAPAFPNIAISNAFEVEIEEEEIIEDEWLLWRYAHADAKAHGHASRPLRPSPPDFAEAQGRQRHGPWHFSRRPWLHPRMGASPPRLAVPAPLRLP